MPASNAADMTDLAPNPYVKPAGPGDRYLDTPDGVVWPCPRCATTLTASASVGDRSAVHHCPEALTRWTPARRRAANAAVAAWWAGYDAARENAEPCREAHVPDGGHCIVIDPTDGPAVILTTGGAHGTSYLLTDQTPSADDVFDLARKPVLRAVLAARLTAMADLLRPTTPEAPQ